MGLDVPLPLAEHIFELTVSGTEAPIGSKCTLQHKKGLLDAVDGAQRPGRDDGIEHLIPKRKIFGTSPDEEDWNL
jgi:hypothetical protein